jgi:hypothetical protein
MSTRSKPWKQNEQEQLEALVAEELKVTRHIAWELIAEQLGRSPVACKVQYNYQKRQKARPKLEAPPPAKLSHRLAKDAAAARAREESIRVAPPTLTARIFGDPPPGRSALDRKRAGIKDLKYFDPRSAQARPKVTLPARPPR